MTTTEAVLTFVTQFVERHGWSPSLGEIGAGVGLSSTSTVKYHIDKLVRSGDLAARRGHPRSLMPTSRTTAPGLNAALNAVAAALTLPAEGVEAGELCAAAANLLSELGHPPPTAANGWHWNDLPVAGTHV